MASTRTPSIMILGTGSNVGKSLLVAGLCRLFADRGMRVRPFKPQNMSNNAAATSGGEIGRAQALQARAARIPAHVDMNPVLLKPESEAGSQIILQGRVAGHLSSGDFARRGDFLPRVLESFERLAGQADLVLVEGAGSPAETNLRARDIANLGFARAAGVPAVLVGDIDRGGVIASLVGTHAVLDEADRAMIRAFAVNRFRGTVSLFAEGVETIRSATGWPCLGVVPWFAEASRLPAEDGLDLRSAPARPGAGLKIAVPVLPGIANFDDLDPLKLEPAVELVLLRPGQPLPGDTGLVILPGSKTTLRDLAALREQGWDIDILAHRRRGAMCSASAAGTRCSAGWCAIPTGWKGRRGKRRASACSTSRRSSTGPRPCARRISSMRRAAARGAPTRSISAARKAPTGAARRSRSEGTAKVPPVRMAGSLAAICTASSPPTRYARPFWRLSPEPEFRARFPMRIRSKRHWMRSRPIWSGISTSRRFSRWRRTAPLRADRRRSGTGSRAGAFRPHPPRAAPARACRSKPTLNPDQCHAASSVVLSKDQLRQSVDE